MHSPGHDLILTAAHCVSGPGLGIEFVPGYHDGQQPFGAWDVIRAYVDPSWLAHQDPQHDYAFLQVHRRLWHGAVRAIEDVVGANLLGTAPAGGTHVTVDGYVAGTRDRPITCAVTVHNSAGYPRFDCAGFADDTSGGQWLRGTGPGTRVVGVIGGLHQGGCVATTSYSSAFGADTTRTWLRASAGGAGDFVPLAGRQRLRCLNGDLAEIVSGCRRGIIEGIRQSSGADTVPETLRTGAFTRAGCCSTS